MPQRVIAYIGLGANLGDARKAVLTAIRAIAADGGGPCVVVVRSGETHGADPGVVALRRVLRTHPLVTINGGVVRARDRHRDGRPASTAIVNTLALLAVPVPSGCAVLLFAWLIWRGAATTTTTSSATTPARASGATALT